MNKTIAYVVLWILVVAGIALGVMLTFPPEKPADISLKQFSVENQKNHITQMAQAPHPLGTAAHGRVQEYILGELRRLELTPVVQLESCTTSGENGYSRVA